MMVYIQPLKFVPESNYPYYPTSSTLFPAMSLLHILVSGQFICKTMKFIQLATSALSKSNPPHYIYFEFKYPGEGIPLIIRNAFCRVSSRYLI